MDEPRRRMERKSGSSSRSPSLSRRPSLKDKKATTIGKVKGKKSSASGAKKERWLLTRKTWRYMSDAVGNLLPESHRGSSTRRPSSSGCDTAAAGPSTSFQSVVGGGAVASQSYHSQQHHSSDIPGTSAGSAMPSTTASRPKSMPAFAPAQGSFTGGGGGTAGGSGSGQASKASSGVTSPTYGGIMSFPSHRPGVTPTGPGPGKSGSSQQSSSAQQQQQAEKFYPPSDDIPTLEEHFEAVCSKEKKFLLWSRTKPKGLSGPALRELKVKQQKEQKSKHGGKQSGGQGHRDSSGSIMEALTMKLQLGRSSSAGGGGGGGKDSKENVLVRDYYSPTEEDDDYDEYDDPDEITVRERRKSSTASSTASMLIAGGGAGQGWAQGSLTFFKQLSSLSSHGSESSYAMILTPAGVTKICRNTGTQTDPFPEELLIRFRLQDVQEERQNMEWAAHGGQDSASRQLSPDNQSDTTGGDMESPMSPVRLGASAFDTQKVSTSPPPTTSASPMSPTTSTEAGRFSGSGRESQEKLLESSDHNTSTRPSISGQESIATTATTKSATTDATSSSGGTDKKSEESGYSSSMSTVLRYLKMVRKNSKADNKDTIDRFKTVNYDRSLRYIKSKNVTVEEALEHEKNKANAQLQQQQKIAEGSQGTATGPSPPATASPVQAVGGNTTTAAPTTAEGVAAGGSETVKTIEGSSPPTLATPIPTPITTGVSPQSVAATALTTTTGGAMMATATMASLSEAPHGQTLIHAAQQSKLQVAELHQLQQQHQQFTNIPSSSSSPPVDIAQIAGSTVTAQSTTTNEPLSSLTGTGGKEAGPPQQVQAPPPPPPQESSSSVGIQAGESLVRFLRNLNPARKMSDFSSSCCSSESPAEVFSPRYSFATTVMSSASDTEPFGVQHAAMASMMALAAAKGVPHHYLQQFQQQQEGAAGGGGHHHASGDSTEYDDILQSHHHHLQQLRSSYFQKQQPVPSSGGPLSSSWTSSATRSTTTTATIKKSSSVQQMVSFSGDLLSGGSGGVGVGPTAVSPPPVATTTSSSSSYSLSQLFHYSPSKSLRSGHHQHTTGGSGSPGTTSTPATPTTSSIGGSSGGLMKTFFGSSPFSSTFGLGIKKGGLRKPTSTTSLTITTNTGSDTLCGRGSGNPPPPTTSSSPNLLSLIQSSAASAGSGFSNLFSSSRGGGSSITATSASRGGGGGGGGGGDTTGYSQARVASTPSSSGELRAQASSSSYAPRSSLPINVESGGGGGGVSRHHDDSLSASSSLVSSSPQSTIMLTAKHKKSAAHDVLAKYGPVGGHPGSSLMMAKGLSDLLSHVTSAKGSTPSPTSAFGEQTDAYLTSSGVMQKSKSSSSVLPLYGSSGSVSGAGTGPSSSTAHLRASPSGSTGGGGGGGGEVPVTETSGGAAACATTSSSGSRLISKTKLFKSRSKSSTRATTSSSGSAICTWSPQGRCKWKSVSGKVVTLEPTNALTLSDVERLTLQDVALEKLRALSLGVDVKIPKEKVGGGQQKPKRRPYLLKKKALSTGFFESGSKREDAKDSTGGSGGSGLVFGISLSQCVTNDRLRQMKAAGLSISSPLSPDWEQSHRRSQNGSRNSVSSVFEMPKEDKDPLQPPQLSVPVIVTACINHLENYGLHTTGIFRVSTSLKRIRQLREDIDSGKEIIFGEDHSPHDVAALLKEFLRDLPEPLLCRDLYQAFLKTQKIRNRKLQLEAIQHLIQLLPVSNRDTLAALLKFFSKVVANACETRSKTGEILPGNKMEGYSLATLIAPNILPCMPTEGAVAASMDQNAALTKERRESIDLVNYMISNYSAIFDVTAELLHDVYLHLMDTNPEAIEGILRQRCGVSDDGIDELETTSSVFEESESGEVLLEPEETVTRVYRRREDILHEGAGKGGQPEPYWTGEEKVRERSRMRGHDESKEHALTAGGGAADVEKHHSGGESDSSSTRSTSRWFRRSRGDAKGRTSSDSGSEKVKCSRKRDSSLYESKRASSLDSVNVQEPGGVGGAIAAAVRVSSRTTVDLIPARPLSGSDQSLRVPEHLNRRQSSPVLESSGIITASLKIPVPVPLNIDDADIPFIEDENMEGAATLHHLQHHLHHPYVHHRQSQPQQQKFPQAHQQYAAGRHQQQPHHHHHDVGGAGDPSHQVTTAHLPSASSMSASRCRSMSTDSSVPLKTASSSVNTTPISSPARQPSSEVSSPTGFSPPTSPIYGTFPVEEMTARMLIGSAAASPLTSSTPATMSALSTSASMHQFHYHQQHGIGASLGAITTTPSSSHHYPTMSKEVMESKSAGSTPITRPKIEKLGATTTVSSVKSVKQSPAITTTSIGSPSLSHKGAAAATMLTTSTGQTSQGAIASLGVVTPKIGDIGTKSAPPSPQPPSTSPLNVSIPSSTSSSTATMSASTSATPSSVMVLSTGEPKGLGKETKGANIGGLIKSKTADFEKMKTEADLFSGTQATQIYSIAPKMRLRSQENVLLKQQFLLRQQQQQQQHQGGGERRDSADGRGTGLSKGEQPGSSSSPSEQCTLEESPPTRSAASSGGRQLTRRRLVGSVSSSAIVSGSSAKPGGTSPSTSQRVRTREADVSGSAASGSSNLEVKAAAEAGGGVGGGPSQSPVPPSGSSPSRWKRSEIIASRQQSQSSTDPETFV